MVKTTIVISDELYESLRRYAFDKKISMSKVIRMALTTSMFLVEQGEEIVKENPLTLTQKEIAHKVAENANKRFGYPEPTPIGSQEVSNDTGDDLVHEPYEGDA